MSLSKTNWRLTKCKSLAIINIEQMFGIERGGTVDKRRIERDNRKA